MTMATKTKAGAEGVVITLDRIKDAEVQIPILGVTPLIPHRWSEKALRMMRDKQTQASGTTRPHKEPKNPVEEAEQSCYWLPDGRPGMPATAFKAAITGAARLFEGVTMVSLKVAIYVVGEGPEVLVPIEGDKTLREDTPRNSGGVADLRYRYAFSPWRANLTIQYNPRVLPVGSMMALVDAAGRGGVGDWRPSSPKSNTGVFGTWRLDDERLAAS
jgi:hypothetical protein